MAKELAATSDRPSGIEGIILTPIERTIAENTISYSTVKVEIDRRGRPPTIPLLGAMTPPPASAMAIHAEGARFYPLRLARGLDDRAVHLWFKRARARH